jgi:hypothetical protein
LRDDGPRPQLRVAGEVLSRIDLVRIDLVRINERVLGAAAVLVPADLRSLEAIHLATVQLFGSELHRIVTYDTAWRARPRPSAGVLSSPAESAGSAAPTAKGPSPARREPPF